MQHIKKIWDKVTTLLAGRATGPAGSTPDPFIRRGMNLENLAARRSAPPLPIQKEEPSWKSANAVPNQPPQTLLC